jgi:hypothetical protein
MKSGQGPAEGPCCTLYPAAPGWVGSRQGSSAQLRHMDGRMEPQHWHWMVHVFGGRDLYTNRICELDVVPGSQGAVSALIYDIHLSCVGYLFTVHHAGVPLRLCMWELATPCSVAAASCRASTTEPAGHLLLDCMHSWVTMRLLLV